MKITKLGHCCLLIEDQGVRILTDPGIFTLAAHEAVEGLDAVVITHEHSDHFHAESLKKILAKNPQAKVITNNSVGKLLNLEQLAFTLVGNSQKTEVKGMELEGFGDRHAAIYKEFGNVENTGYFFGPRLFYPGDAFVKPVRQVEILAVPVAGPWMKFSEAISYVQELKPQICFPVHDGILKDAGTVQNMANTIFNREGIKFLVLKENGVLEI